MAIEKRILDEIRGRMMEEIVLLETKIAKPTKQVFQLQFAVGEFDMVVFDPQNACLRENLKQERHLPRSKRPLWRY